MTVAILFGMFAAAIEMTIVATAMPRIAGELGGSDRYAWVLSIYLLTNTVSAPLAGKLADLYGRRPSYLVSIALFLLGSWLCGAAWSMNALIVARAIQGAGGGGLATVGLTIIGDIYTPQERGKIQGLFSAVWGSAGALGPWVGGAIVDNFSWRWVFYLNVPFGLIAMVMLASALREKLERRSARLDYAGAIVLTLAIIAMQLAGGSHGPKGFGVGAALVGALLLALFFAIEKRAKEPVLPLSLLANRTIGTSIVVTLLSGAVMFGVTNFVPLYVQGVQGASAQTAGATMTPYGLGWPLAGFIVGLLLLRIGYRRAVIVGYALVALGALMIATLEMNTSRVFFLVATGLIGCGMGISSTPLLIAIQTSVPWDQRGIATAAFSFCRTLGGTLGVILSGAIQSSRLQTRGIDPSVIDATLRPGAPTASFAVRDALGDAVHHALVSTAVIAVACLCISFFFVEPKKSASASVLAVAAHE